MPRETAQERKLRQVELSTKRELEYRLQRENYFKDLPRRLSVLAELADSLNVSTEIKLLPNGVSISFSYRNTDDNRYFNEKLSYLSEEHEVVEVEYFLYCLRDERDIRDKEINLARTAYQKLTADEQAALKKYIEYIS